MVLFEDRRQFGPPAGARRRKVGTWLLGAGIVGFLVFSFTPAPYVLQLPGPVYDTLGTVEIRGETVPLIEIEGAETYPTSGTLDLLTVSTRYNPDRLPDWWAVLQGILDPSIAVLPVGAVYPPGTTVEQSNEDARIQMEASQQDAVAAALIHLGYELNTTVSVASVQAGLPAEGVLEAGDRIVAVDGVSVFTANELRERIQEAGAGTTMDVDVVRNGEPLTLTVTPARGEEGNAVFGIFVANAYDFPFTVTIQLENVGGPSGGQMFALGIIDKLTPGELTGGEPIAGTGTIGPEGRVGPIGGIRQKMYGALRDGARWFLAPASNCEEVVGHIPDGLTVFAVDTLDDSIAAVEAIARGDTASIRGCTG